MDKPPHLTLVKPTTTNTTTDHDQEFIPLPFYPWSERPSTLPLDPDEAATAIHIAKGDIPAAAALLKVPEFRLNRLIRRTPISAARPLGGERAYRPSRLLRIHSRSRLPPSIAAANGPP